MDTSIKVMAIDDSKVIRKLLTNTLKKIGFNRVYTAETALGGLKSLLSEKDFGLILLDWEIGDLSGIEVLEILRRRAYYKDIPILMITCRHSKQAVVKSIKKGANGFLTKPFTPKEFKEKLEGLF